MACRSRPVQGAAMGLNVSRYAARLMRKRSLEIDGSHGEGGGQLVRTAVALAAVTGTRLLLRNIRARRAPPGLAPQHLAAVRAVAALCGAQCQGLELRADSFEFVPSELIAGDFTFDIGTAGSITLVLQALLPVMIRAPQPCRVRIIGGTDVRAAPPIDYFIHVLLPLLSRTGAKPLCSLRRRGYYPRGGGIVELAAARTALTPLRLPAPGRLLTLEGLVHVANLPAHILDRMSQAAVARLHALEAPVTIERVVLQAPVALGQGGAVALWARTQHSVLGATRVAERGVRAETLGEAAAAELATEIESGASIDLHAADQILIYAALAGAGSDFTARTVSPHAETAMWLIEQFLPVRFRITDLAGHKRVETVAGAQVQ